MVKKRRPKRAPKGALPSKKSPSTSSVWLYLLLGLLCVALGLGGYLLYKEYAPKKVTYAPSIDSDALMHKMKQMLEVEKERLAKLPAPVTPKPPLLEPQNFPAITPPTPITPPLTPEPEVLPKEESKTQELSEVHEYKEAMKESGGRESVSKVVRKAYPKGTTPKLAIIIDDVSFAWQTRLLKEIPYKVTPAFFPPSKNHPSTVQLSQEFAFAMVHLPLEAKYYHRPEEATLMTTDSDEVVEKRIQAIKRWFPHIRYYNNHTGGYFTAHYEAMDRLIRAMKKHDLVFVDSRTIGNSKAPEVTQKHGMFLYSRDVFLDNSLNKAEIKKQLELSVAKAKKNGYAIAIGHPHKNTLEVLRDARGLLNGVEMVYVNEL